MNLAQLLIFMIALVDQVYSIIKKETPDTCKQKDGDYFFDTVQMKCVQCKDGTIPDENCKYLFQILSAHLNLNLDLSCVCAPGFKRIPHDGAAAQPPKAFLSKFHHTCEKCPAGSAPSSDGLECLTCSGSGI